MQVCLVLPGAGVDGSVSFAVLGGAGAGAPFLVDGYGGGLHGGGCREQKGVEEGARGDELHCILILLLFLRNDGDFDERGLRCLSGCE